MRQRNRESSMKHNGEKETSCWPYTDENVSNPRHRIGVGPSQLLTKPRAEAVRQHHQRSHERRLRRRLRVHSRHMGGKKKKK